ncbi:deoxynucleoside kinase [Caldibacillus thermolactis]|jgi:deoxyadenosine/deoxycytidine kinase|uniref:Deoxynucleoside kinase n=1 Tax=Pallidibacillus thermolactis TaxID=251051 RepID=A0ABT2WJ17_9BACI|nr:deoxynucleoside kinase [Pallidibacillus thermolactis]MCU9595665.1 deoxynucleoside kinase [Pallidibacillus thermolactis]MCU9602545.1 deoxynucleoside kinase [Pallidibacillus thermolactis subsp. kokeshiiformis]MED1672876.1 deoxynucleoside kinase [Pallidibacillus thermolactis subsp. kokeshiiformis]
MNLREKYNIPNNAVITIAGTVGVGKSTMTKSLAKALNFRTSFEKVDTNPYLDKYYKDFKKWSFHLQIYFLAERFKEAKRIFEYGGGFVQDRSIYEDTGIFARMQYEKGNMTKEDYETYTSLFDAMVMTPFFHHPDLLIYLEGSFEDILARIKERGRPMEQETPVEYWQEMYERYTNWINNFQECPILRININDYDLYKDESSLEEIISKIGYILNESKAYKK